MLKNRLHRIIDVLLIFNLFFFSNASVFFFVSWLSLTYLRFTFVIWFVLVIIAIWAMKKENLFSVFFATIKRNWFIIPFVVFAGTSIFWSVSWEVSLYRWMIFVFTIIAGGYFGLKYEIKEIIGSLSVFCVCILLFATLLILFFPNIGLQNYFSIQGAWKGPYWQKNHMGAIVAFANILFLMNIIYSFQLKEKRGWRWIFLWCALYLFSLFFVSQTDSVGSFLTIIVLHGVLLLSLTWLSLRQHLRGIYYVFFFALVLVIAFVLLGNLDYIFGLFKRNTTLTGRIPMWTFVFKNYLSIKPLGGYGFNAFWYLDSHQLAVQKAAGYPEPIIIADNGFIDILINTGFVGLFLFLIFYFGVWWRSITFAIKAKDIIGVFPLILMFYTLVANISWSLMFENEGFFMLIMISVLFYIFKKTSSPPKSGEI